MTVSKYKVTPYNRKFTVYKIPFSAIESAGVSLKDKNKTYSVAKHAQEMKWDIAVNGAMFDMRTHQNVTDLIVGGVVNNGGNYTDKGIAFGNPWAGISAYWTTTANSRGKQVDFIGGAPTLVIDGKINMDMKGLTQSFATALRPRTAIGIDSSNIYIVIGLGTNSNLNEVANEFIKQGARHAINLDGGGSTSLYADGKTVYTQGRNVTSAFGIRLKQSDSPVQPSNPTTNATVRHTVKKGESLSKIAKLYGASYKDIAKDNNIKAPLYIIRVGQVLTIKK